ncbi:Restriction endonuclease subunit S OS=Stutzerimonas stutzeri OX=316 GN=N7335_21750 PE=4 SV=1 [Stutzerimonas stutzeri]
MSHYKPYPAYKDSGVEWLGRVPEHWQIKRLKHIANVQTGVAKGKDNEGKDTVEVPYLRVANVQDGYLSLDDVATIEIPREDLTRYSLQPGDVLMNEGGDFDKLGRGSVWQGEIEPCIHQNHVFAVRPTAVSSAWLNTFTGSLAAQFYFMGRAKQSTNLASISSSNIMELPVAMPPATEVDLLLAHIDRETARIDALIEKKTRFIELLREKRQALITHAVTKGLDPTVKMKDSGVEWLGEVPEHWACKKLMYWMDGYGSGTTPSKDDDYCIEGGLPWVTTGELREGLVCETDKRVTDAALSEYSALKAHPVGSLVIAMYGATVGRLGLLGVPAALNQACFAIHPCKTISIRMLRWWFEGFRAELIELATGAGQPNISGDKIRNLFIAAPLSLAEQEQIADQIESRTLRIDGLVSKTERSIELLKERRSALITAAVTGQIDLREAV